MLETIQDILSELSVVMAQVIELVPLEPIREVLESDESDVIHCWALDSLESARCGSLNTALRRTAVAFVTRAI
jgi:hypothetical protein